MPDILDFLFGVFFRFHDLVSGLVATAVVGLLYVSVSRRNTGSTTRYKRMRPGFGLRWVSVLWFPFAGILAWTYFQSAPDIRYQPGFLTLASILFGFWGLAAGQLIEIKWDKNGISKQGLFRKQSISWSDLAVTGYDHWMQSFWVMDTAGKKIRFSELYDGYEEFTEDVLAYFDSIGGVPYED